MCFIENFDAVHTFRVNNNPISSIVGGGVSIFSNCKFYNICKIDELSLCNENIETCAATLCSKTSSDFYVILGVYRPPSGNKVEFIKILEGILMNNHLINKTVIVAGDMNMDLNSINDSLVDQYLSSLNSLNFVSIITEPTHFFNSINDTVSSTNLDHIFTNVTRPFDSFVFDFCISDHCGTCILCETSNRTTESYLRTKIVSRPYSENNLDILKLKLDETNWDSLLGNYDANEGYDVFIRYVNDAFCSSFPKKTKFISPNRKLNPWITDQLFSKIRLKSQIFKLYKNNEISRNDYNLFRNRLNKEIKREKKRYYTEFFLNARKDMKKSWKTIRNLMGDNNNKNKSTPYLPDSCNDSEKINILNKFNDFFANVGHSLANIVPSSELDPCYFIDTNPNSFFLHPATPNEIEILILKLKDTKTHIDEIPVRIFKKLVNSVAYPIKLLLNSSFSQGIFPEKLKIARISPIHKSGDSSIPSNFCPISSLHYMSKIYERAVSNRLMSFCSRFSLISRNQFGFQAGISTNDALIKLTECLYKSLNDKKFNFTILVDIRKAFDCVNHSILLSKLYNYGIRGSPHEWFASYLKDRKCFIENNDIRSNINVFNTGLPQGSILGPCLFLLVIEDLPKISNLFEMILFADDTTLTMSNSNFNELVDNTNMELDSLKNWINANKLTVNTDKTELLFVSNRLAPNQNNISIEFQGASITPVNDCRYLGVQIDDKLSFRNHIQCILGKISKYTGILYKIRSNLPISTRINYYYAFIHPYLSYNILVWGNTFQTILEPINIQLKRIVRIICGAQFRDHTDPLFKKLKILKLHDLYRYHMLIYMHKQKLMGNLNLSDNIHNTRHHEEIRPQYHRLTVSQHSVSFMGPKIWNSLPHNMQSITNNHTFRKKIKNIMIENY